MKDPKAPDPRLSRNADPGEHLGDDLCLDLVHGLLPEGDRQRALAHAADCPRCEGLLAQVAAQRAKARTQQLVRAQSTGELVLVPREAPGAGTGPLRADVGAGFWTALAGRIRELTRPGRLLPAAAVAAAAVLIWLQLAPPPGELSDPQGLQLLPSRTGDMQFRAATDMIADQNLVAGIDAYAQREMKQAIALLQDADALGHVETIRRIYLGSALAWEGRYPEAVATLRDLSLRLLPDPWSQEARWTLYLALMRSGEAARAESLLQALIHEPGEIGDRARRVNSADQTP
jgi:hypothetical protein